MADRRCPHKPAREYLPASPLQRVEASQFLKGKSENFNMSMVNVFRDDVA
jgi:hypothetical protein